MISDALQQQEELGRKIAAALSPLGFGRTDIQEMAYASIVTDAGIPESQSSILERLARALASHKRCRLARMAGVAAYFEEQGK